MRDYRKELDQKKGQRTGAEEELAECQSKILSLVKQALVFEEAQRIVQEVAQSTQEELRFHVEELVSMALSAVFDDPCKFEIEFVRKRGTTECNLWFVQDGNYIDPLTGDSGGLAEVAGFALRVALWSLKRPRNRATFVLDEPLKWLKGEELPAKGAEMIKAISKKIGLQIIMVSHIPDQIEGADRRISVTRKNQESSVAIS